MDQEFDVLYVPKNCEVYVTLDLKSRLLIGFALIGAAQVGKMIGGAISSYYRDRKESK